MPRPPHTRLALALVAVTSVGCNLDNPGVDPPPGRIHFPLGIELVDPPGGERLLLVVNSNFDAAYNAGTLQVWRRADIEGPLVAACALADPANPGSVPQPDCPRALVAPDTGALADEVWIPSVAWDIDVAPGGDRLYIAVEGRGGNLTHVDFDPTGGGQRYLSCGQGGGARCGSFFAYADPGLTDARGLDPASDQKSLAVGDASVIGLGPEAGTFALVAERRGSVELYVDRGTVPGLPGPVDRPTLLDVIGPLAFEVVTLAFDPQSGLAWLASPDSDDDRIQRVGVTPDPDGRQAPSLFAATPATVRGAANTAVTRDIAFPRLDDASGSVVILSGTNSSGAGAPALLFASDPEPSTGIVDVRNVVPICQGPSRLERATLAGRELLFVSCFNGRRVDIIDAVTELQLTSLRDAGGVYDLAVDDEGQLLWVADFEASSIRLADLSPLVECLAEGGSGDRCEPRILGSLGVPTRSREL